MRWEKALSTTSDKRLIPGFFAEPACQVLRKLCKEEDSPSFFFSVYGLKYP